MSLFYEDLAIPKERLYEIEKGEMKEIEREKDGKLHIWTKRPRSTFYNAPKSFEKCGRKWVILFTHQKDIECALSSNFSSVMMLTVQEFLEFRYLFM